jgi:hypothetical protein
VCKDVPTTSDYFSEISSFSYQWWYGNRGSGGCQHAGDVSGETEGTFDAKANQEFRFIRDLKDKKDFKKSETQ